MSALFDVVYTYISLNDDYNYDDDDDDDNGCKFEAWFEARLENKLGSK